MACFRNGRVSVALLLLAAGCSGPSLQGVSLVSGTARREGKLWHVTAQLRNDLPRPVNLDEVVIEMTTYGSRGQVLARGYPFSFGMGQVAPGATTRLLLNRPDRDRQIERATLSLKDLHGRPLSELDVRAE